VLRDSASPFGQYRTTTGADPMPDDGAISQSQLSGCSVTRRAVLGAAAAVATTPALAEECRIGLPAHEKGPRVWLDMDQVDLDAAYDQLLYAPVGHQILPRFAINSEQARARLGPPQRVAYGPSEFERLDIYRTNRPKAPIFLYIHGGAWLRGSAADSGFPAEIFVNAGAHYVVPDFIAVSAADGDLRTMAEQVRRAIAWTYSNAGTFDGDPERLYIGGHSSGGHLCGVALVTDWKKDFELPETVVKGGLCMSGMYDLKPVRLSARSKYVRFTDEIEQAMSPQRHLDLLRAPIIVTYGTNDTPEFQRQSREFAAAVKAAGKPVELIVAESYNHFETGESLGNPYGPNGRAAMALMKLTPA
jgi:arylformamidase